MKDRGLGPRTLAEGKTHGFFTDLKATTRRKERENA